MTSVYTAPEVAIIVRGFAVDPSLHRVNTQRESGPPCGVVTLTLQALPFVQTTFAGAVYVPAGHPAPETLNCTAAFASIRTAVTAAVKFAVIVLGASISTVRGFAPPPADPDHPAN